MTPIILGGVELPMELVSQTTAILGIRGTGKTTTAVRIVEQALAAGVQVIVCDPLDVWWGLRSSRAGDKPGYPIPIFGGDHEDAPLTGRPLAEWVVQTRSSAILSLSHLPKDQQRKVIEEFCTALYELKSELAYRDPVLIVVDEASMFVPQMGRGARESGQAITDLVRRGRSRGVGMILIDQRAASINKDVLTQLEVLICHKQTSPQDRRAILDWVEAHGEDAVVQALEDTIASLKVGEAWVWSPALAIFERTRILPRTTFDSGSTPKIGEVRVFPSAWAPVDVPLMAEATDDGRSAMWPQIVPRNVLDPIVFGSPPRWWRVAVFILTVVVTFGLWLAWRVR